MNPVSLLPHLVRLHKDSYLKTEKRKREPIPILITESADAKRKRIIGSVPLFKTESESETDTLPAHSKYIKDVLTHKVSHDPTFGVHQDDTDDSFVVYAGVIYYYTQVL